MVPLITQVAITAKLQKLYHRFVMHREVLLQDLLLNKEMRQTIALMVLLMLITQQMVQRGQLWLKGQNLTME